MKPTTDSSQVPWVPLRPGVSFKPLRFLRQDRGWVFLMRVDPGVVIARHRHTGEVHGFNLEGHRKLIDTGEVVGPGGYVYEPPGNEDSWMAVGDAPLVTHVSVQGAVEYVDEAGRVLSRYNATTQFETYRRHCEENGLPVLDLFD